jgi:hypothetical protein
VLLLSAAAAAMIFRRGTAVWVEYPEFAWVEAEVVSNAPTRSSSPSAVTVVLSNGTKVGPVTIPDVKVRCSRCVC